MTPDLTAWWVLLFLPSPPCLFLSRCHVNQTINIRIFIAFFDLFFPKPNLFGRTNDLAGFSSPLRIYLMQMYSMSSPLHGYAFLLKPVICHWGVIVFEPLKVWFSVPVGCTARLFPWKKFEELLPRAVYISISIPHVSVLILGKQFSS